ncbi:MAG: glycosyltransferase [Candidatus Aminicenantia bacterium]
MMKRVVVVTSTVPLVYGGHLVIAINLKNALKKYGFEADIFYTPQNPFGKQFQSYLANFLTDLSEDGLGRKIDQIISLRFPSYAVRHPMHVLWLNHRMREYDDLWDDFKSKLSWKRRIKEGLRRAIISRIDHYLLTHNVNKIFSQSQTIRERLIKWGSIDSEVLYPPPPERSYRTESYENFIFTVSRLYPLKRIDLLIKAFQFVKNREVKALIAGEGSDEKRLKNLIDQLNLRDRVFMLGRISNEKLVNFYSRARAIFFSPYKEDFGFVTMEAFASKKAVITCTDSGGPAEIVKDKISGFIVEPDPEKIAEKIDEFSENRNLSIRMGEEGFNFVRNITWEKVLEKLIIV